MLNFNEENRVNRNKKRVRRKSGRERASHWSEKQLSRRKDPKEVEQTRPITINIIWIIYHICFRLVAAIEKRSTAHRCDTHTRTNTVAFSVRNILFSFKRKEMESLSFGEERVSERGVKRPESEKSKGKLWIKMRKTRWESNEYVAHLWLYNAT